MTDDLQPAPSQEVGPDSLPTMAELEAPEQWLERVGTLTD